MAKIIEFDCHFDMRGELFVLDDKLPFIVNRIFFIRNVPTDDTRGFHRHVKTRQILFCSVGSCKVHTNNRKIESTYELINPQHALLVEPEDWHTMDSFSPDCILTVLASEKYDPDDYIKIPYTK